MNDKADSQPPEQSRANALSSSIAQERVVAAQQGALAALELLTKAGGKGDIEALIAGAAPDDADRLRAMLGMPEAGIPLRQTSNELAQGWQRGVYPYKYKMLRKDYEREKFLLQAELLKLQTWVRETGARVVILSMHQNEEYVRQALRHGAVGYLLKDAAPLELELAVMAVCVGLGWCLVWLVRKAAGTPDEKSILFGQRLVDGVLFPLVLLSLAYAARGLLAQRVPLAVFHIVIPAMVALVAIRIGVKVLQVAFD